MASDAETRLSAAALVVALVAMMVTTGQLLGQYFATAEGYRRCQPSVMGQWARRTRLRVRWSQFRLETLFTVPEIYLEDFPLYHVAGRRVRRLDVDSSSEPITGSMKSRQRTMVEADLVKNHGPELASWLPFLSNLHKNQLSMSPHVTYSYDRIRHDYEHGHIDICNGPMLHFRERSWDFMPPDIVRPMAVSNISCVAVLACRLGMAWKEFRPEQGIMRAEGNGHVIFSVMSRVGIILQYMSFAEEGAAESGPGLDVPSSNVDLMYFGIIPGCWHFKLPGMNVGTEDDVFRTMQSFHPKARPPDRLGDPDKQLMPGISDLMPLASPMFRIRGTTFFRVPAPSDNCWGLLSTQNAFVVFHHRLTELLARKKYVSSPQLDRILTQYEQLRDMWPMWNGRGEFGGPEARSNVRFLDDVHDCWDDTTRYFLGLQEKYRDPNSDDGVFKYYDLMACHLVQAPRYIRDATERIQEHKTREHFGMPGGITEGVHMYHDYAADYHIAMAKRGFFSAQVVEEAWYTMMFRAMCWWQCHLVVENARLPSQYCGSRLPVYIT